MQNVVGKESYRTMSFAFLTWYALVGMPAKKALEQQGGVACEWEGDEEEEEEKKESQGIKRQALQMQAFMAKDKDEEKEKAICIL